MRRVSGSSPLSSTKKKVPFVDRQKGLFLSKPQAWHIITTQSCISSAPLGLYIITRQRASSCGLLFGEENGILSLKGGIRLKIHGVKREWSRPFWVRCKKHYCPTCKSLLTAAKRSKIVNSKSEEAKNYDFSFGDTFLAGNIKFIWTEFLCATCDTIYSLREISDYEKTVK